MPLQRGKPDTATTPYKRVKWQTSVTSVNGTVSATTTGFRVILGRARQIPVNEIADHSPVWPPTFQDFRGIITADYLTYKDDNGKVSPNKYDCDSAHELYLCFATFQTFFPCPHGARCRYRHAKLELDEVMRIGRTRWGRDWLDNYSEFYVSGNRGLMPEVHQNSFPVVFQDVPTSGGGSLAKSGYAAGGSSYASNAMRSSGSSGATTGAGSSYADNAMKAYGGFGTTTGAARVRPLLEPFKAIVLDDELQAPNARGEATQRPVEAKHTYTPTDAKEKKEQRRRRKQRRRMQSKEALAENLD
jgi:hypothetical protein